MLMNEEQIAKVYGNYQNKDATNDLLIENNNLLSKINKVNKASNEFNFKSSQYYK